MVIDTSAIVAILQDEPEGQAFAEAIESAGQRLLSAPNFVECSMVISARFGDEGLRDLDLLIARAEFEITPINAELALEARRAWLRFGKGRHAAGLNFGDTFAYALAVGRALPLLYKGNDFSQTDVTSAVDQLG